MKSWRKPLDQQGSLSVKSHINIDRDRCKGCGFCSEFCPREVLEIGKELNPKGYPLPVVRDESRCLQCGYCEAICPEFAITVQQDKPNP